MIKGSHSNQWFYLQKWKRAREEREKMNDMNKEIDKMVDHFRMMAMHGSPSMIHEVREQYLDMASGGNGGDLGYESAGESTCRGINYPGHPDWFFQKVIERMEWR